GPRAPPARFRDREITVAFADLVGYTELGQAATSQHIGQIANRFASMASDVAEPPVRLIKLIGDAALLVSTETAPLLGALSRLIATAAKHEGFPPLHAGV